MSENIQTSNDLLFQKKKFAKKAFYVFALNSILSSVGLTISTTVDAIIVGNAFGENGLAVTSVVMPVYMVMNLLSIALGIGGSIGIANAFGKDNIIEANKTFNSALVAGLSLGVLLSITGTILLKPIVAAFGGSTLGEGCYIYVGIVLISSPVFILPPILNMMLRSDADPGLSTLGITVSSIINIILDLFFIYVVKVGIYGAAIAMVIGQTSAVLVYLIHFFKKKSALRIKIKNIDFKYMITSFKSGFGSASYYIWQSIQIVFFNNIMNSVSGESGIAVFNLIFNVSMFAFAVFDGISSTMPSLIGTYFGEKDYDSIKITFKISVKYAIILSSVISVILLIFAPYVVNIFGLDASANTDAVSAVRFYSISIIAICLNSLLLNYYQTIGKEKLATAVNILRGVVLLILFGYFLIMYLGSVGIPIAMICAEYITLALLLIFIKIFGRKKNTNNIYLLPDNISNESVYEITLDRDFERLPEICDAISQFCEEQEVNPKTAYYINLTIEELTANIVEHGFKDNKQHFIAIKVAKYDENVFIRIRDDATGYNPFDEKNKEENEDYEMDFMGVELVKNVASQFNYQRKLIFNNLLIIL